MIVSHANKVGTKRVFEGEIFNVRLDNLNVNGINKTRAVVEHAGGVVIACKPTPNEIFLIRQNRYAIDQEFIELYCARSQTEVFLN